MLDARHCNKRDDIAGALVCRRDIYLQLLEGPADMIDAAYGRIMKGDRHLDIKLLVSRDVEARMFAHWDMLHDPAKSWLWSMEDIDAAHLKNASPDEITGVFAALADKVALGTAN